MSTDFMTYDKFMRKLAALEKKFPLKDDRKADIADALAIVEAVDDIDEDDFEDLVEVMDEAVRLKKRFAANLKLVEVTNNLGLVSMGGPDATEALRAMWQISDAKRSSKSEEAKAKEISGLLKKQMTSASKSAVRWGKLSSDCAKQAKAVSKVSARIKKARKTLSAKLNSAPSDAVHKRMGEIILGHLDATSADITKVYGDYWVLEVDLGTKSANAAKWATEAGVSLAKLKGKNALPFLAKLVA